MNGPARLAPLSHAWMAAGIGSAAPNLIISKQAVIFEYSKWVTRSSWSPVKI